MDSRQVAAEMVAIENAQALECRINKYQREIDEALTKIATSKESRHLTRLVYTNNRDEAVRVHTALSKLGYRCTEITRGEDTWCNGIGNDRLSVFTAQY